MWRKLLVGLLVLVVTGVGAFFVGCHRANEVKNLETNQVQQILPKPLPTSGYDARGKLISENELGATREFKAGQTLGRCLANDCLVFFAIVRNIGPPEKDANEADDWAIVDRELMLEVSDWLWGDRQALGTPLQIKHSMRPTLYKSAPDRWSKWEGVEVKLNEKLLLALTWPQAGQKSEKDLSEQVVLAVSNGILATKASEAVNMQTKLTQAREALDTVPAALESQPDDFTAGYIISYLARSEVQRNPDGAARTLSSLLKIKTLSRLARDEIATEIITTYDRASVETRSLVAKSLVETAADNDLAQSVPALSALIWMTENGTLDLKSLLNGEQKKRVSTNYQAAFKDGLIDKGHSSFEFQLGIRGRQ